MIRKSIAFLLLTMPCLTAFSQSFVGYGYDNYSGVNGVLLNPAVMAGSKYKVNVNLFAISGLAGNNAYEIDRSRLFGFHLSNMPEKHGYYKSANSDYKYLYSNLDILGPSATISLTKKDALGVITRLRYMSNEYNLGDSLFRLIGDGAPGYSNINMMNRSLQLKTNAFAEAGVSYSRVIFKGPRDEMKLGITGKYLVGLGYASLSSGPIAINVDPTTNTLNNFQADITAQYSANVDSACNGMHMAKVLGRQAGRGWGVDIGFVYEKMGEDPSTPKLRLGVSITDIGTIRYKNSANSQEYMVSATGAGVQQFGIQSNESVGGYITRLKSDGFLTTKAAAPVSTVNLPTALHLNLDYQIYKRVFINGDILFNMVATTSPTSPNYVSTATITPRLEKKWVSIYSPVSYNVNGQLTWGAGVRFGPVFVGSGSVLSSLFKQRLQTADAHIGLTIPIFQHGRTEDKKHKADTVFSAKNLTNDRDGDGVVDSKDNCPDSAGPVALIGCPDRDGDGVPDIKDKCPDVKGSPNFQGCPAPDSDGDSVADDEDKCPLVKGLKSNFGCPAIRQDLVTRVNNAADRIYFVRAKANIEPVSFGELERVADVLKSDSTLRLRIEGFTDSEGPDAREMRLSARRAQAVEKYLVVLGIAPSRMETIGYGKKKPLAPNDSPEGMARNRRVEMVLMNYPGEKKQGNTKKPAAGDGGAGAGGSKDRGAGAGGSNAGGADY